jgi:hypothetical protein
MPKFVEHHTDKNGKDQADSRRRLSKTLTLYVVERPDGRYEEQKSPM